MVSITIVTWNSAQYLDECFASIELQDCHELEVIIVDNASTDGTRDLLRRIESRWRVIYNDRNVGFAAGQNQAIQAARGDWVLCLNPDVVLSADFVTQIVAACGKRIPMQVPSAENYCAGIRSPNSIEARSSIPREFISRANMRHLDRGAEETDTRPV